MSGDQKQPMQALNNLDDVEWVCPCGSRVMTPDVDGYFDKWLKRHAEHTDGTYLSICTDDGARAYAEKPAPRRCTLRLPA